MSEQRRLEIVAKRARSEALRAQRVERQAQALERRSGAGTPSSPSTNLTDARRTDVNATLDSILGPEGGASDARTPAGSTPPGSTPGTPARGGRMSGLSLGFGAGGRTSDAGGSTLVGTGSAMGTGAARFSRVSAFPGTNL